MRKTTGISLMLLIFLTLCLMTFSLLALSGAKADETLSQEAADRTTEYYAASAAAHEVLSQIDAMLADALEKAEQTADPERDFLDMCLEIPGQLSNTDWGEAVLLKDSSKSSSVSCVLLPFYVFVKEDQLLLVELTICYPQNTADTLCSITAWEIQNTADWTPDTSQNLYLPKSR